MPRLIVALLVNFFHCNPSRDGGCLNLRLKLQGVEQPAMGSKNPMFYSVVCIHSCQIQDLLCMIAVFCGELSYISDVIPDIHSSSVLGMCLEPARVCPSNSISVAAAIFVQFTHKVPVTLVPNMYTVSFPRCRVPKSVCTKNNIGHSIHCSIMLMIPFY